MDNSKFSLVLRMHRENSGLTQRQVADALKMERSTYAYYETGTSRPSASMIVKLSRIFNVDSKVFLEAVADSEFDESPEDENYTTLSDSSSELREKMNTLKKDEQNLVIQYRSFNYEEKEKIRSYFKKLSEEQE